MMKKGGKYFIIYGTILISFLLVSTATAIPIVNASQINHRRNQDVIKCSLSHKSTSNRYKKFMTESESSSNYTGFGFNIGFHNLSTRMVTEKTFQNPEKINNLMENLNENNIISTVWSRLGSSSSDLKEFIWYLIVWIFVIVTWIPAAIAIWTLGGLFCIIAILDATIDFIQAGLGPFLALIISILIGIYGYFFIFLAGIIYPWLVLYELFPPWPQTINT